MSKVFIVAGEVSGDQTGAWYIKKILNEQLYVEAVGGSYLKGEGVKLYEDIKKLNITGALEILGKLRFIFRFLNRLAKYIATNDFQEVVLVDFPGFNLMLAKRLKKLNPNIKITYLSPPQLWIWGSWRLKKLKKYCDRLVVLYPFEVEWYKQRGLSAEFVGNPLIDKLNLNLKNNSTKKQIVILPGSRKQEIKKLFPFFAQLIKKIKLLHPNINIFLPLAKTLDKSFIEFLLRKYNLHNHGQDVSIVSDENEKLEVLKESALAITKPGTVTLELALLEIPSIVIYKTSWTTYFMAKLFVKVKYMSLPNLFMDKVIYKEFIQKDCKVDLIFNHTKKMINDFIENNESYKKNKSDLNKIKNNFFKNCSV